MVKRSIFIFLAIVAIVRAAPLRVHVASDSAEIRTHLTAAVTGGGGSAVSSELPSAASLAAAEVLVFHRTAFEPVSDDVRRAMAEFAARGGGIVAIQGAVAAGDAAFGKELFGGAWTAESRKFRSRMMLYIRPDAGPVGQGASSFDVDDDTVYDLDLSDDVFVIASAFTPKVGNTRDGRKSQRALDEEKLANGQRASIYDIQAQIWTRQGAKHRAAVFLQGDPATLRHAGMTALLLRAAAWTAGRDNADELNPPGVAGVLRYPVGGPLRPEDARQRFQLPPDVTARVVASEPLIAKPVAVQWDARGRLWVAETPEYPNGRRLPKIAWKDTGSLEPDRANREARDSISVLEDTDGDGVMDRKSVFLTGIELVCGFCFYRDGLIVLDYPHISWIRDTDGDGKSDRKEILFGNLPFPDHFILNHLIFAPDGWIYGSSGKSFQPVRPGSTEPVARISPGVFRFRPDGSAIEQVGSRGGNSFGIDITGDFEIYQSQATSSQPIQHLVLPERVLVRAGDSSSGSLASVNPMRKVIRQDLPDRAPLKQIGGVGYYSAACSSMVFEGGAWPAEYDGTVWCTEPILDIVHHERLVPKGPTFAGELVLSDREWLRSTDYWFCPVDVTFGPNGDLYVLDFYTPVVAHNDTRGPQHGPAGASVRPDREHYFGRIWQFSHRRARNLEVPDLTKADADELIVALGHPNRIVRFHALAKLMDSGAAVSARAGLEKAATSGPPSAQVLALWALQRSGGLSDGLFATALRSPSAMVRKNALLAAEEGMRSLTEAQADAALADDDPRVRLAALRVLAATGLDAQTGAALLRARPAFTDPWSRAAAAAAAASNPAAQIESLFAARDSSESSLAMAASLGREIAARGLSGAASSVVKLAASDPALGAAVLEAFSAAPPQAPADAGKPEVLAALRGLLQSTDVRLSAAVLPLAVAWDRAGGLTAERAAVIEKLLGLARDNAAEAALRIRAIHALAAVRAGDDRIVPAITALLSTEQSAPVQSAIITALGTGEDAASGEALVTAFAKANSVLREQIFRVLITRSVRVAKVLDALEAGTLDVSRLSPSQLSALRSHPDRELAARAGTVLAKLGRAGNPKKDAIIESLLPAVRQSGDPAKGRVAFAACAACHRLNGEGVDFGPPLDGMGAQPVADLLVHIVDPNRAVDDEHRTWNIVLKDGTQYAALIASENAAGLRLKLPGGMQADVRAGEIASLESVRVSLMPEGLEALGAETIRDIIAYLRSLVPSPPPPEATAPAVLSGNFRPIDLGPAFTADNRRGLYASDKNLGNTLPFVRTGRVIANGIPFDIADPATAKEGRTLVILKAWRPDVFAASYPVRVEIPIGLAARRLHFLGGIAGWGGQRGANMPVMKVTLHYRGGAIQSVTLRAGHEFADYIRRIDVPGSQYADGIVREKQVRTFAIPVERSEMIDKLVLESVEGTRAAATTVAITAELPGAPDAVQESPAGK